MGSTGGGKRGASPCLEGTQRPREGASLGQGGVPLTLGGSSRTGYLHVTLAAALMWLGGGGGGSNWWGEASGWRVG